MSLVKKLLGEKQSESVSVTVDVKGEGAQQFVQFVKDLASFCNAGCSRSLGILDPSDEGEKKLKWSFDGDGNTRITVKDSSVQESNATTFKPERAVAFVEEFRNGKRILVLTATQAELVQSREDLRQFKGPFVAFSLQDLVSASYKEIEPPAFSLQDLVSASYKEIEPPAAETDKPEHPTQFSSGTAS